MDRLIDFLNNYTSRDAIIRTCSYTSLLLSEYSDRNVSKKLKVVSKELSYGRLINRFFDDIAMLRYTLQYGFGSKEKNKLIRLLSVLQNAVDQIYFPVEHIAWAAEKKIIAADSSWFYNITSGLWAISCYLNILRCLVTLTSLERLKKCCDDELIRKCSRQQLEEIMIAFKSSADFIIAISYLPPGTLMWAGKLSTKRVAWLGFFSSILRIILCLRNMP